MKRATFILFCGLLFSASVVAQTPQSSPLPRGEEDVVKITTKLVQTDAIVTDKSGNQIKNLTVDDFELLQDGKPQKITNFSYVDTEAPSQTVLETKSADKNPKNPTAIPPPVRARSAEGGRLLTFVVDDGNCAASHVAMIASREGLEKFINEQMQPNDLVAIYQTRGGSALLQQYTSDKAQLLRVARRIRWYPALGSCGSESGDIFETARNDTTGLNRGRGTFSSDADRQHRQAVEDANRENQVVGTLGVLNYVVRGLERVGGGRKIVFFLSDGLPLLSTPVNGTDALRNSMPRTQEAMKRLTDLANRASVVFETIDARGLIDPSLSAADSPDPNNTGNVFNARLMEVRNTQDGLFYLANETGGTFYHDKNFLDVPIRRALNLEKGYYLLAYQPDEETFKSKNFNKIQIKVKRPELKVISRAGFYGKTDDQMRPKARTGDSELYDAISAPLIRAGLNVQLTAFYGNTPAEGDFVRSLVHLDGRDITFADEPDGNKKVVFDIVAVTFNEKNEVVDEFNRTYTVKIPENALSVARQNGLVYTTDVPVKKAGTYNFRLAVRDANSHQLGASSQVIEIPDLKKSGVFLSGLTVSAVDASGKFIQPAAVKPENAISLAAITSLPAIRQFRPGTVLAYSYTLYNAQIDKGANQPKLSVQVNLYQDGKLISEGQPQAAQLDKPADLSRINDFGYLRLNPNTPAGDYDLQIVVKDLLANRTTSQDIDFEVVK